MPELPEVETVMRGLSAVLLGRAFTSIDLRRKNLRFPLPMDMEKILCGHRITGFERRAKYMLLHFEHGHSLIIHLGMSGRMVISEQQTKPEKHDHVIFKIAKDGDRRLASLCERSHAASELYITFNDPRRFGMMDVVKTDKANAHKLLMHLGVEPLSDAFTAAQLHSKLSHKKIAVKLAIMDQRVVVGVGNIYACEALFASGIHPTRCANSITKTECTKLVRAIKDVLSRAIAKGGSSLRDYVQADGGLGYFQHEFAVYGREGEPCTKCDCANKTIMRITQGGRSTFYCPERQKK